MAQSDRLAIGSDHIKKGELEMFTDFFNQVAGESMSDDQQQLMVDILDTLHKAEENQ
jgi:exonuclease SbcD